MTVVGRGNNLIRETVFTYKTIISDNYNTIISTTKWAGKNGHSGRILGSASEKLGTTETGLKVVKLVKAGKEKEFQHFFSGMCAGKNPVFNSSF